MKRVYVAGKYNDKDVISVLRNMRKGINASVDLLIRGYAPFCPWLDFQFGLNNELSIELYKEYSMAWLRVSDAVLMVDGWENSKGAIAEKEEAERLGIPVYYNVEDVK